MHFLDSAAAILAKGNKEGRELVKYGEDEMKEAATCAVPASCVKRNESTRFYWMRFLLRAQIATANASTPAPIRAAPSTVAA